MFKFDVDSKLISLPLTNKNFEINVIVDNGHENELLLKYIVNNLTEFYQLLNFGKDKYGRMLLMTADSMHEVYNEQTELEDYTLFHHTMSFPEQTYSSLDKGYIFMKQETGELNLFIHANPAGGIGLTMNHEAHFMS